MENAPEELFVETTPEQRQRVREFHEKRCNGIRESGFVLTSYNELDNTSDPAFIAMISMGGQDFTIEYDGWGGDYVYAGKIGLIAEFSRFANGFFRPLCIEYAGMAIIEEQMKTSDWIAEDELAEDMIEDFMYA